MRKAVGLLVMLFLGLIVTIAVAFQNPEPSAKVVRIKQTTADTIGNVFGNLFTYFDTSNLPHRDVMRVEASIQKAYGLLYADTKDTILNPTFNPVKPNIVTPKPEKKP